MVLVGLLVALSATGSDVEFYTNDGYSMRYMTASRSREGVGLGQNTNIHLGVNVSFFVCIYIGIEYIHPPFSLHHTALRTLQFLMSLCWHPLASACVAE